MNSKCKCGRQNPPGRMHCTVCGALNTFTLKSGQLRCRTCRNTFSSSDECKATLLTVTEEEKTTGEFAGLITGGQWTQEESERCIREFNEEKEREARK